MAFVKMLVGVLFGADWATSLIGMGAAAAAAAAAYAGGHTDPGFYLLAFGLAALGRFINTRLPPPK